MGADVAGTDKTQKANSESLRNFSLWVFQKPKACLIL